MPDAQEDISEEQFQSLQEKFQSVLEESRKNDQNSFSLDYEELLFAFKRCFAKKRQLQLIIDNDLNKKIEEAWNLVEVGRKKETAIAERVIQLEETLARLSKQLKDDQTNHSRDDERYSKLIDDRDALKRKLDELLDELHQLEKSSKELKHRNEILEEKHKEIRSQNTKLREDLSSNEKNVQIEKIKCEQLEKDLIEIQGNLDSKTKEYIDLRHSELTMKTNLDTLNRSSLETQKKLDDKISDYNEMSLRADKLEDDLRHQKDLATKATAELVELRKSFDVTSKAKRTLEAEKSQLQRKHDNEHKAVLRLQQNVDDVKAVNLASQQEMRILRRDIDKIKENENELQRQKRLLEREKNIHVDKIHRMEHVMKQADEDAWHQEQTISSLEKDLSIAKCDTDKIKKKVHSLEQICEKQKNEITDGQNRLEKANNEIHSSGIEIQEMKKELSLWRNKCKEQEHMSNRCRSEQGKAFRELLYERNENQNAKSRNTVLSVEVETLRHELLSKDEILVKSYFDKKKESTHKEQLSNEIAIYKRQILDRDDVIQKQTLELQRMTMTLKQMDEETVRQKKDYDQLIHERDILSAQLIRRNDELALLYEKVKIQAITLNKGEMQYKERIEDLRHLQIKFQDTKRELSCVRSDNTDHVGMSNDLIQRERDLLNEKVKVKALSEELQNPLNVHRWRQLEGSDPSKFELVQKNDLLQKRLINKTEEVSLFQNLKKLFEVIVKLIHNLFFSGNREGYCHPRAQRQSKRIDEKIN